MTTTRRILFLLATLFLWFYASYPRAATFSDLWWNPNESGWGVNVIQQQDILFVTLFVYSPSGQPTWYVGPATTFVSSSSGQAVFTGALYTTSGPWFAGFFNPGAVGVRQVGNVTFAANSQVRATLTYSVDGVPVTKSIQRQTWRHITLGGTYYGAIDVLNASACGLTGSLVEPFYAVQTISATVSSSGNGGTLNMAINDGSGLTTFAGTYVQYGSLYDVAGTLSYSGSMFTAAIRDFTADDDGIRGNLLALVNGCTLNFRFAAVRPG